MSNNILHTIYFAGIFLLLFASAEFLYHKMKMKVEITRKYVHFATGFLTMLFPPFIQNHWLVLLLCCSFIVILKLSLKFNLLPSINAVERETKGSILYPMIVYGCYFVYIKYGMFIFYYIPILVLAIADPVAALLGKRFPYGKYQTFKHTKTLIGSAGFFVAALITCLFLTLNLDKRSLEDAFLISLNVAFVCTIAEAITHKGYDNLTIPASALLMLMVYYF